MELYGQDKDIQLIGFGESAEAVSYVGRGIIDALFVQDNYGIGQKAIDAAYELVVNGSWTESEGEIGTFLVTDDNWEQF